MDLSISGDQLAGNWELKQWHSSHLPATGPVARMVMLLLLQERIKSLVTNYWHGSIQNYQLNVDNIRKEIVVTVALG